MKDPPPLPLPEVNVSKELTPRLFGQPRFQGVSSYLKMRDPENEVVTWIAGNHAKYCTSIVLRYIYSFQKIVTVTFENIC